MEPATIFAAAVALIGAIHILSNVAKLFGNGIYDRGNRQAKREDWYCFFQPSDLLGEELGKGDVSTTSHPGISDTDRLEQRRRQQAGRPRLHA